MPKKIPQVVHNERPPVICVMGHVDHGKSTLLDYIRESNVTASEAGGITQHMSAYEVVHETANGKKHKITFLDTPGHEAFAKMRSRGASVADIAVLVVSAEDGVKKQTLEAYDAIKKSGIPFVIAINKIDKEGANIEKTKNNLMENNIFLEGWGGDAPFVPISAKTGTGVNDLLDTLLLIAEIAELKGDSTVLAEGIVLDARLDTKKGVTGTLIIKNGTLRQGMYIVSGVASAPVRIMEDCLGSKITEATFSSPIRIVGWSALPEAGDTFVVVENKKEAEKLILETKNAKSLIKKTPEVAVAEHVAVIPVVIKADVAGSLDAIEHELNKIKNDRVKIKIIFKGAGDIGESDVKIGSALPHSLIIGFNVKVDAQAQSLAEKLDVLIHTETIIYKLAEWIESTTKERTPKMSMEEVHGRAKIMKMFSKTKDKQIIGGKVFENVIRLGDDVRIIRRENILGNGIIKELQQMKTKAREVENGNEFGAMVESKIELAPGDIIECFGIVEK